MRIAVAVVFALVMLVGAGFGAIIWEDHYFQQPGPSATRTVVVINAGSGLGSVAEKLTHAGVLQSALLFEAGVMRRGNSAHLKAGEYGFPPHVSEAAAMEMLIAHKVIEHRITIAEGLSSEQALSLLVADKALSGSVPEIPEGSLLPETYMFELG